MLYNVVVVAYFKYHGVTMNTNKKEILIYRSPDGRFSLEVNLKGETVWLMQKQVALLFNAERSVITKHINNILKTKELEKDAVCAKIAHTAEDGKTYQSLFYNLDMILSVGYRINSKRGTQFRIWATQILKEHLLQGYTINEHRLREQHSKLVELEKTVHLMGKLIDGRMLGQNEADGLLRVITDFAHGLAVLDQYDHQQLSIDTVTEQTVFILEYDVAREAIDRMRNQMYSSNYNPGLFGIEKDNSFKSSLAAIYQTFGGKDLYPSIEERAAHLLYFIVKNHSFSDGNKRIGASLFLWFLDANRLLYMPDGRKRIGDNALVALTLLIAESNPSDKETIIKVIVNLINRKNLS